MLIFILIFLKSECERLANEALLLEHTQHSSVASQQTHFFHSVRYFSSFLFS